MSTLDQQPGAAATAEQKFSEMNFGGKIVHIGKVILFFVSFGFAFPTIFSGD